MMFPEHRKYKRWITVYFVCFGSAVFIVLPGIAALIVGPSGLRITLPAYPTNIRPGLPIISTALGLIAGGSLIVWVAVQFGRMLDELDTPLHLKGKDECSVTSALQTYAEELKLDPDVVIQSGYSAAGGAYVRIVKGTKDVVISADAHDHCMSVSAGEISPEEDEAHWLDRHFFYGRPYHSFWEYLSTHMEPKASKSIYRQCGRMIDPWNVDQVLGVLTPLTDVIREFATYSLAPRND